MSPWRQIQKKNFTDWKKLADFLHIDIGSVLPHPKFPLNLPRRLAEKIRKGDLEDPILLQFLPTKSELENVPGFSLDPVEDLSFLKGKKLLHKYKGRALLVCTGACVMNCRFCFRQNFPYEREEKSFEAELETITANKTLVEILLSGGDPLSLSDQTLEKIILKLDAIPHLKRLRINTRFPLGIPERIDTSFLNLLKSTRLQVYFVLHTNHPNELDEEVFESLKKIHRLGIPIFSQGVLLKGVNDSLTTLKELMGKMIDHGVVPYQIHQLDKVQGAAHFEVEEKIGLELLNQLSAELPGYGIPRYVKEVPGRSSKTLILHSI